MIAVMINTAIAADCNRLMKSRFRSGMPAPFLCVGFATVAAAANGAVK